MKFEECLAKNLIRDNKAAKGWVKNELKTANKFLHQAQAILKAGQLEATEIMAYNAIFHMARALLYSKGYSEKSHYCLFVGVSKLYDQKIQELCKKAHHLREARHTTVYGGKDVSKEEAKYAVSLAKEFKEITEKILAA